MSLIIPIGKHEKQSNLREKTRACSDMVNGIVMIVREVTAPCNSDTNAGKDSKKQLRA